MAQVQTVTFVNSLAQIENSISEMGGLQPDGEAIQPYASSQYQALCCQGIAQCMEKVDLCYRTKVCSSDSDGKCFDTVDRPLGAAKLCVVERPGCISNEDCANSTAV